MSRLSVFRILSLIFSSWNLDWHSLRRVWIEPQWAGLREIVLKQTAGKSYTQPTRWAFVAEEDGEETNTESAGWKKPSKPRNSRHAAQDSGHWAPHLLFPGTLRGREAGHLQSTRGSVGCGVTQMMGCGVRDPGRVSACWESYRHPEWPQSSAPVEGAGPLQTIQDFKGWSRVWNSMEKKGVLVAFNQDLQMPAKEINACELVKSCYGGDRIMRKTVPRNCALGSRLRALPGLLRGLWTQDRGVRWGGGLTHQQEDEVTSCHWHRHV